MLETQSRTTSATPLVISVATVIGLTIMGDSLMYSLLPLEAESLGIPIVYVGLLLSINRIVRLGSNAWAGVIFEKHGARLPFIFASLIAIVTTLIYSFGWGLVAFLLARAGWGLAWSLLRQGGYFSIWAAEGKSRGKLTGVLWGLVRLGSAISVVLGGWLYDRHGFSAAVMAVSGFAFLALPIAIKLRWPQNETNTRSPHEENKLPSWQGLIQEDSQRWLMAVGFAEAFFDSVIVSTASLFLAANLNGLNSLGLSIGTTAGLLLAVRFGADIVFSPIIGSLSDRLGQARSLVWLSFIVLLGLSGAIFFDGIWVALSFALVFVAISGLYTTGNASASGESEKTSRPQLFVGLYSTAIDTGAAVGPLFVFSSAAVLGSLNWIYMIIGALLFLIIQRYFWSNNLGSNSES
jgi:MFS family permease